MSAVLSIILIVIAAIAAFFIGRWHGLSTGSKELSKELESKDKELDELKSGVNEHFDETARLFTNLTEEYKTLYQHLATGASQLSDKDFKLKLSAPVGAETLSGDVSVSSASAAEVIDAEEHLTPDSTDESANNSGHEEESFIRDNEADDQQNNASDEDTVSESFNKKLDEEPNEQPEKSPQENPQDELQSDKPDLDIEVSPPKDWAEDDLDEDYHPNESSQSRSEFSDLANEAPRKPSAPGYERDGTETNHKPDDNKQTKDKVKDE